MSVFVLAVVLFLKDSHPMVVSNTYPDRFTCEVKMAAVAEKDTNIAGWTIPLPCVAIPEANKV